MSSPEYYTSSSSSVSSAWRTSIVVAFVQFEPYSRAGVSAMKRPCGDAAIALLGAGPAAPGAGRPGRPFVPFTVHWDSESQSSMLKLWITDRCAMCPVPLNLGILPCFFAHNWFWDRNSGQFLKESIKSWWNGNRCSHCLQLWLARLLRHRTWGVSLVGGPLPLLPTAQAGLSSKPR